MKLLSLLVISSIVCVYNVEHDAVDECFHRTVIFPILGNLITEMEERFGNTQLLIVK